MAKLLYSWGKKRYERERKRRWDENWDQWKNSLERGNLKGGGLCYKSPEQKKVSRAFKHLVQNLKVYNRVKI